VFVVIEGMMEFRLNGEVIVLKQGQSINLPPKTVHTFSNNSNKTCKWINIHSPKGFLNFFKNLGVSEKEEQAELKSVSSKIIKEVMATAADYDMIITH
jgi:glyoxylate utilization-related uncharacterized protein